MKALPRVCEGTKLSSIEGANVSILRKGACKEVLRETHIDAHTE